MPAYLEREGRRVIRFWNADILGDLKVVMVTIHQVAKEQEDWLG